MTENEYKFVVALSKGLSFTAVAEKMRELGLDPDKYWLGDVMLGVRKIMWNLIGEHFPTYAIGMTMEQIVGIEEDGWENEGGQ